MPMWKLAHEFMEFIIRYRVNFWHAVHFVVNHFEDFDHLVGMGSSYFVGFPYGLLESKCVDDALRDVVVVDRLP